MNHGKGLGLWDELKFAERFLTAGDLLDCESNPSPEAKIGQRPAVLSIDNYRSAYASTLRIRVDGRERDVKNRIAEYGMPTITRQRAILDMARKIGVPIIHFTKAFGRHTAPTWFERTHRLNDIGQRAESCPDDFAIIPELSPQGTEPVMRKSAPSCFSGTPLIAHLAAQKVDTLVFMGESTSGCVRASVVDAVSLGFLAVVVADCVFDRHEASHAISLFDMSRKYARVVFSDGALSYLRTSRCQNG